jgi:hypothetical protein
MAWPCGNLSAGPTDVRGCQSRVIHRLPLFLSSIIQFQGKKTVVWQRFKYGYGEQSRHYGEQSRVKSEQSRVKSEQSRVKRVDKTEARL